MAGSGETYKRADGRFAFRVKSGNGQVVATDGGQGYEARSDARTTLANVMAGAYKTYETFQRVDARWAFRIKAANGQVVATDGSQGYESKSGAESTARKITAGEYNGPINDL